VLPVVWRSEPLAIARLPTTVLPFACGRSYGDSCLNPGGVVLDVTALDRFMAFDPEAGMLRCEAGVTLAEILAVVVPHGWFLPVVPGTQHVSVGGAIANDIHGKNHHRAGTFGMHVVRFELLRSDGQRFTCSSGEHADLFCATIGGLGLTGLIVWAELRLKPIPGTAIALERIRFESLDEFFGLSAGDADFEYTVAWVDCLRRRNPAGRGVFMRGDHAAGHARPAGSATARARVSLPWELPGSVLCRPAVAAFNTGYYWAQRGRSVRRTVHFTGFFFPLDGVRNWNRLYGRKRLVQYQCVVPPGAEQDGARALLSTVRRSGEPCFLAVLKRFGALRSPGLLSFPRPGATLALDFPFRGSSTLRLLDRLDELVVDAGGAVYPAKDTRMSGRSFRRFFPAWETFAARVDPKFSSSFWRRVTSA
jgi:FAD/FMN-containing dehydrogenase